MNVNKFQLPAQQVLLQQLQGQNQLLPPPGSYEYDYYRPVAPQFRQYPKFQPPMYLVHAIAVDDPQTLHWLHQTQLCQMLRAEEVPHLYARQHAQNLRKNKNPYSDTKVLLVDATRAAVAAVEEQEQHTVQALLALMRNKKTDLDTDEEQRMMARTHGRQLWCHLDLLGQGVLNVAPRLFQYDFLELLYLNNNKLQHLPAAIKQLTGLRVLDVLHNRLTELPPELGLCYNLRYLYLFDNGVKLVPAEFRNLIELQFIGIEGNPMDLQVANLVAEKGARGLVEHLRDMTPAYDPPKPREWLQLEDDGEVALRGAYVAEGDAEAFSMMLYNTLCHHYATVKLYKYTPRWALEWEYRKQRLTAEILEYGCDVVCLQEVETRLYNEYWLPLMEGAGYKGLFYCKTRSKTMGESELKKVDGCATFYKTLRFQLLHRHNLEYNTACMVLEKYKKTKDLFNRFMNKDHIALVLQLQHVATGEKIVFVNTHLHWDPAFNDVKALQVGILLEELQGIVRGFGDDPKTVQLVICGDFNSTRHSAVYQLFATGKVLKHLDLEGRDYGRFTDEGFHHNFKLKLAYDLIQGNFPFTNYTPTFTNEIDYMWYTLGLQVRGLLGKPDEEYLSHHIGIPNAHFPSDHIPLVARFQVRRRKKEKEKEFKPEFKPGTSRKT